MKLFVAILVLFITLSFQFLNRAKGHEGDDMDSLKADIGLLRKDLREVRLELRRHSISDVKERKLFNNLKKRITKLETEVTNLRSDQASSQQLFLNLQKGILTDKRMRQHIENNMGELKTAIRLSGAELSEFQVAVVRNYTNLQRLCECPTRSQDIADSMTTPTSTYRPPVHTTSTPTGSDPSAPFVAAASPLPEDEDRESAISVVSSAADEGLVPPTPAAVGAVREPGIVPELRFTRADGYYPEFVVIEAGGAAVMDGPNRGWGITVLTDGLFPADRRVYWETRLDWSPDSDLASDWWPVGGVGVRREGSDSGGRPGTDDLSWGVWIRYDHTQKSWLFYCRHGGEYVFQSAPVTVTSPSISHRLGLLLDPGNRTLTAVDVNTNSWLCTSPLPTGGPGSQRLVPVVWFGDQFFERRFSLSGVDPSRLPGAVTDLIQN